MPMCAAVAGCSRLDRLKNGRYIPIRGTAEAAFRFVCNPGYHLVGPGQTICTGGVWSHGTSPPVCAKPGCDELGMGILPFGSATRESDGAMYRYACTDGLQMIGKGTLFCDGHTWNGSVPMCPVPPSRPLLEVKVAGVSTSILKPGTMALITCTAQEGNPHPEVGITFNGQPVGSKEFRRGRNTFTFTAGVEDNNVEIVCTSVNTFGSSRSSLVLTVQMPDKPSKNNIIGGEEIFWIPFQPTSNEAEERLFDVESDLREVEKVQGGTFEKAEQLDPAKDSHQEENLVGHDTNTKTLENEESFAERETLDIKFAKLNSSTAHAQISSLLVKSIIFMQSLLY